MTNPRSGDSEEESEIAPQDTTGQLARGRAFRHSTGRQQLIFVPASGPTQVLPERPEDPESAARIYESIVFASRPSVENHADSKQAALIENPRLSGKTSLAHQASLEHSHPPSHLDRRRNGFRYLASYGWDADSRLGLGPSGEGLRAPLKGTIKRDTAGLGIKLSEPPGQILPTPACSLDASKVRKQYAQDRKRTEKLREKFYGDGKIERYLGQVDDT